MKKMRCFLYLFTFCCFALMAGCGFHLQGERQLAPPLHRLYLRVPDSYGQLARILKQSLKMSGVQLTGSPEEASTVLNILRDDTAQQFLSVSSSQQTRQYLLSVTVLFEITDAQGRVLVPAQALVESRPITIQSDQILGSSNEANLFYQQMRRTLAYSIMNRLSSKQVSALVESALITRSKEKSP